MSHNPVLKSSGEPLQKNGGHCASKVEINFEIRWSIITYGYDGQMVYFYHYNKNICSKTVKQGFHDYRKRLCLIVSLIFYLIIFKVVLAMANVSYTEQTENTHYCKFMPTQI